MLFDTHCHLTDPSFAGDLPEVLRRAEEAGVAAMISIASTVEDARAVAALAAEHPAVRGTVGIHPHHAGDAEEGDLEAIRSLAVGEGVVALGETGLDYHYDNSPRDVQRRWFEAHLELAGELGLPVVVHSRSANRDTEAMVRAAPPGVRGVLHCFGGDLPLLETALDRGWSVSYGGVVSFRRFDGGELLQAVPRDRLLLETDAPYLAPVPHRGRRNEPALVALVRDAVAACRGEEPAEVEEYTWRNGVDFFRAGGDGAGIVPPRDPAQGAQG